MEWIPLTPADLLDPWPGWETCQDWPHSDTLATLYRMLRRHFEDENALVTMQMKMIWHIPGLPEPAPDIAIIQGIREVNPHQWYFDIVETGLLPSLVIEIATMLDPEVRRQDYEEKKDIYERIGIHRLGDDGRYSPIEPDSRGRLRFKKVVFEFGVAEDGSTLEVFTASRPITQRLGVVCRGLPDFGLRLRG
ncbi:MAG TPA: Uma2 family endonuclease [Thermoanaerobaculia bacterium]